MGSTPWLTLVSSTYDGRAADHPISPLSPGSFTPPTLHDTANYGVGVTIRGNPTQIVTPDSHTTLWYDYTGTPRSITEDGVTRAVETSAGSSYAVPTKITANGYATNMSWNSLLQMTGQTGANGETMGFTPSAGVATFVTQAAGTLSLRQGAATLTIQPINGGAAPALNRLWLQKTAAKKSLTELFDNHTLEQS